MSISPNVLKKGDIIVHQGKTAKVLSVRIWTDALYGKVYGVDLLVRGKSTRVSFTDSSQVELREGEAT